MEVCKYCGKENIIYKLGYCVQCYKIMLKNKYILNPNSNFNNAKEKELIDYFLENPETPKKDLAKKFELPIRNIYYYIKKYTICIKVED